MRNGLPQLLWTLVEILISRTERCTPFMVPYAFQFALPNRSWRLSWHLNYCFRCDTCSWSKGPYLNFRCRGPNWPHFCLLPLRRLSLIRLENFCLPEKVECLFALSASIKICQNSKFHCMIWFTMLICFIFLYRIISTSTLQGFLSSPCRLKARNSKLPLSLSSLCFVRLFSCE